MKVKLRRRSNKSNIKILLVTWVKLTRSRHILLNEHEMNMNQKTYNVCGVAGNWQQPEDKVDDITSSRHIMCNINEHHYLSTQATLLAARNKKNTQPESGGLMAWKPASGHVW